MSLFGARNTQEYNIIQRKRHSDMSKICCRMACDLLDDGVVLAKMREKMQKKGRERDGVERHKGRTKV